MSLIVRDTEAGRAAKSLQGSANNPPKNAAPEAQPAATAKTPSVTEQLITSVIVCQLLLAAGLALAAALYVKTHMALYAVSAGLLVLIVTNLIAVRAILRHLGPLHELADRANEISMKTWNFEPRSGSALAKELAPLAQAMDRALTRFRAEFRQQRDFTSDAAHELKTSVAIVKSALQLLLHRPRTQREYQIGLEGLLDDCARLEDLLERMLRLARIEQLSEQGVRPKAASSELRATCEAAISRIRSLAEDRGVAVELEASAPIPLLADPEDMELIWMNLLENAVQNSPAGSTVKMRVDATGKSMAQVSVLDSGPGIAPAELPRIFERFYRGELSPERSTCGFGLGLAICKALVDAYGGTIEARNLPLHGAEIRVELPVHRN